MSAAFFGTFGHGTERSTGSAPGPAKVATRMALLRMGSSDGAYSLSALLRVMEERPRKRYDQDARRPSNSVTCLSRPGVIVLVAIMHRRFTLPNLATVVRLVAFLASFAALSGA